MDKKNKKREGRKCFDEKFREMDIIKKIVEGSREEDGIEKNAGTPLGIKGQVVAGGVITTPAFAGNINCQRTGDN